jgi:predicted nucleic acid-binding protein
VPLIALLDANALWSAPVRDTLLRTAEQDLYRPAWTRQILDEMLRSLLARRPDLDPARLERTVDLMLAHFPDALVEDYEDLIPAMRNDPGDRHVLAAAVRAGASLLVTWNISHFPAAACDPYGVEVRTPDEFLVELWDASPHDLRDVLYRQAAQLARPRPPASLAA